MTDIRSTFPLTSKALKLLVKKPNQLLHHIVPLLVHSHNELQKQTITFLTKFISYIKTLDEYNCVKYTDYNKIFSENTHLYNMLELMIGKDNKNNNETIFKLKGKEYNKTVNQQI